MFDDLIEKGLVSKKTYSNGLSIFKYRPKVFYDKLWGVDPLLVEARGLVLDAAGKKIVWPFTKIFNHHENGTDCPRDKMIEAVEKVNGFLAAATWYGDDLIVSTTGTLDSEYAILARKVILSQIDVESFLWGFTYLFEICDASDPHIVKEVEGAHLIGMRHMRSGVLVSEEELDHEALQIHAHRPAWSVMRFEDALTLIKTTRKEGFMIRDAETKETLMKIKSPYYLITKFLMRLGKAKMEVMFNNTQTFLQTIDEEFYGVVEYITKTFSHDTWGLCTEQERRYLIEDYFFGEV